MYAERTLGYTDRRREIEFEIVNEVHFPLAKSYIVSCDNRPVGNRRNRRCRHLRISGNHGELRKQAKGAAIDVFQFST